MKKGWKEEKLGDVCEYDKSKYYDEGLPYIGLEHIESNTGNYLGDFSLVNLKSSTFRFSKSHLLYGRLRPYLNKVLIPDFDGHCSTEIFPIKLNSEILREYLFYWFIMGSTVAKINATCTGARMPRANMNEVINFPIPIPPLAEQKKIVAILDRAFAAIDEAKANTEQNIVNAKEIFQSRLDEIFSNPQKGWKVEKLGELGKITSSKRIFKKEYVKNGVPFYRSKEIKELGNNRNISQELFISSEHYSEIKTKYGVPKRGDLLLTAVGTIGETYIVQKDDKFYFKDGNIIWFKNFNSIDSYFLKYSLKNFVKILQSMSKGTAYKALTINALSKYSIPIPPLAEQKKIVTELEKLRAATDQMVENYEQKLEDLEELRKSILERAFLGELT